MSKNHALWQAVGMLPEGMVQEAMTYPGRKKQNRKRAVLLAVAAVMAVSCLGWAAKEWIFAPGVGLAGTDTLDGKKVYMTTEEIQIGKLELEAVILTEDRENPENNVLTLWAYRYAEDASPVGTGEIHFPESDFTASVNGVPYRRSSGLTGEWGYQYMNFTPAEAPELLDGGCSVFLQYPEGEGEIQLREAEGGSVYQNTLDGGMIVSLLPLTDNLYAGSFVNPAWQKTLERLNPYSAAVGARFATVTENGENGIAHGTASLNGFAVSGGHCIGVMDEYHDQAVASMALETMDVYLSLGTDREEFSFILPEVGETQPCDILLWDDLGFTCRLTAVSRTEEGLEYRLERSAEDGHISGIGAGLEASSGKPHYYQSVVQCNADGTFVEQIAYSLTGAELPAGTEMTLRLIHISFRYESPDGTPLTTFTFD